MDRLIIFLGFLGMAFSIPVPFTMPTPLDHFGGVRTMFNLRYWHNAAFAVKGGPIFVVLGGPQTADLQKIHAQDAPMVMYAKELHAHLFLLEHRFFGRSIPTGPGADWSKLTTLQVLADVRMFVEEILPKAIPAPMGRIVVFGELYSGTLAVWTRHLTGHPTFAAVASSAPLEIQVEYTGLYPSIQHNIEKMSLHCADLITKGFAKIQEKLRIEQGRIELQKSFNTCEVPTARVNSFFWIYMYMPYIKAVEHQGVGGIDTIGKHLCEANPTRGDPLPRMVKVHEAWRKRNGQTKCAVIDPIRKRNLLKHSVFGTDLGDEAARLWLQCNELGNFPTTKNAGNFFGGNTIPLSFHVENCQKVFNPLHDERAISEKIRQTIINHGGEALQLGSSNLIVVNGLKDPWRDVQMIDSNPTNQVHSVTIGEVGQCADTYRINRFDPVNIGKARQQIVQLLQQILH